MIENCEYSSIVKRAGLEGWLSELVEAHALPCTRDEAEHILALLTNLPKLKVLWRKGNRGRARFSKKRNQYGMTLSAFPGGRCGGLRAGLVLHEAAHILQHVKIKKFDHQEVYCRIFRRLLLQTQWRTQLMPTRSFTEIYNRHRGPFTIMLTREIDHGGKRGKEQISDRISMPLREEDEGKARLRQFSAEEAHEEARMLVGDPRENVTSAFVFSESEGQFIGACYSRGSLYRPWAEEEAAALDDAPPPPVIELSPADSQAFAEAVIDPAPPNEALQEAAERQTGDWKPLGEATKKPAPPKRRAGLALQVAPGSEAKWPPALSAQLILATFKAQGTLTAKEAAEQLAPKLIELGVAHPASAVSRLKQAGLLEEVAA